MLNSSPIKPFGEISFENEIEVLGNKWEEYFFDHTPFVAGALSSDTYLIVGRRGSGKSSLMQHFLYQDTYTNSDYINIGRAENYNTELFDIARKLEYSQELAIQKLVELWDFIIWQLIFKKLVDKNGVIKKAIEHDDDDLTASNFIKLVLRGVLKKVDLSTGDDIIEMINEKLDSRKIATAKERVLEIVKDEPLFIVIDSREQYAVSNFYEMWITAALIQCASQFNVLYARKGIHLKVCIADEIFPYMKEQFITNTLKYIRNPLYMYWRPKDLMRLICWRFFKYLKLTGLLKGQNHSINWDSHKEVYQELWLPYFGQSIINSRGIEENTFPYILRHTHLRPRQLILVCNKIARLAKNKGEFPRFSPTTIIQGIVSSEVDLADELINSYRGIQPSTGDIISSLEGLPMEFMGNELYKAAKRTSGHWNNGEYSPLEFIKLVVELGIIGRKRGLTDHQTKIIKADFEFAVKDRLFINEKDACVIHPLFYSKLNINRNSPVSFCVYPFPNMPEFQIIEDL